MNENVELNVAVTVEAEVAVGVTVDRLYEGELADLQNQQEDQEVDQDRSR